MDVEFTVRILKEGDTFVAHGPQLDVSTCGDTEAEARRNIADAVQGFLETAREQGTLNDILQEAGCRFENGRSECRARSIRPAHKWCDRMRWPALASSEIGLT